MHFHTINVEVRPKPGESDEKLIKRFLKKCKKQEIIREYLDRVSYAKTKSQKRRQKRIKNRYLRQIEKVK